MGFDREAQENPPLMVKMPAPVVEKSPLLVKVSMTVKSPLDLMIPSLTSMVELAPAAMVNEPSLLMVPLLAIMPWLEKLLLLFMVLLAKLIMEPSTLMVKVPSF